MRKLEISEIITNLCLVIKYMVDENKLNKSVVIDDFIYLIMEEQK